MECKRHHKEITAFRKCNMHRYHKHSRFLLILCVHIVLKRRRRRRRPGWCVLQKAAVQREAHRASGMGRKDAERDGNYLSLASSCQPLSGFRSSATEWRETNKSEKRQAGEGDTLPQESTCLVDLFLGTLRANYTISLRGCDEKQSSSQSRGLKSSFWVFVVLSPWAAATHGMCCTKQDKLVGPITSWNCALYCPLET